MIRVTNDARAFFEEEHGDVIIYGAGNAGHWIGYYMNRCNLDFLCYIDRYVPREGIRLNGHEVCHVEILKEFKDKAIRIVISPQAYKEILADLMWFDHKWPLNALCIIPQYVDVVSDIEAYNINKFLGYFRRKLFKGDTPTIISNTCVSGFIYEYMNMPLLSPTINAGMTGKDYIKFCSNMKHYLDLDLVISHWEKGVTNPGSYEELLACKLDDIEISFGHLKSEDGVVERWNLIKERINWNRIVFVMEEIRYRMPIGQKEIEAFKKLDGKKLMFQSITNVANSDGTVIFAPRDFLSDRRGTALENYFDLLSWFNED